MTPEMSRPVPVRRAERPFEMSLEASEAECAALAGRLRIPAVRSVSAVLSTQVLSTQVLSTQGGAGRIVVTGHLVARVIQECVVTLEPIGQVVDERFVVHLVPAGTEDPQPDPDDIDQIPYAADQIDLGEVVAEQLALALDPYPRDPGAELPADARDAGVFASLMAVASGN